MRQALIILAFGLAAGYWLGFRDAQSNDSTILERVVARVGGDHRGNMITDVDRQMEDAER